MSNRPQCRWLRVTFLWVAFITALVFSGCGIYVPDGSTVVSVLNSKHEFERASLRPAQNELGNSRVIKMKWYDTNTFISDEKIEPGSYSFTARNFDGAAIQQDITVVGDTDYYEIDVAAKGEAAAVAETAEGPVIKGKLIGYVPGGRPGSVSVLFIGTDIIMRSATLEADGQFSVKAPRKGQWKIEVHKLGAAPKSYVHPVTNVAGPLDLGGIVLK